MCWIFQSSLIRTLILVQISVFIDRLRVVLRYMHSYQLILLMSNINNSNKLKVIQMKLGNSDSNRKLYKLVLLLCGQVVYPIVLSSVI